MYRDVMLHVSQDLSTDALRSLGAHVDRRMGVKVKAHASSKPHLFFFEADLDRAPPHAIVEAVRDYGCDAKLVDL